MEIWVVPFFGQGHLLPSIELCKQIASRGFKTVLVIPSNLSSSVPAALRRNPLLGIVEVTADTQPGPDPHHPPGGGPQGMSVGLETILKAQLLGPNAVRPVCAVIDVMMDWTAGIFQKFEVPTVGFFTSGAGSAALEYATWKAQPVDVGPGEVRLLPGLPDEMGLTHADTKRHLHRPDGPPPPGPGGGHPGPFGGRHPPGPPRPPGNSGPGGMGPPGHGDRVPWMERVKTSTAVMINTCEDLERPFIEYIANQLMKPVWAVGPLLPEQYWKSIGVVVHDHEIRTNRQSNVTEDEVIQWLDAKPRGSVLYVSFGTEVGPTAEEYSQLADALGDSTRPFIWVVQHGSGRPGPPRPDATQEGFYPRGLEAKVGPRGLIIDGWAPQLLILSHPSTGGFLSHCGWNSTMEAIGRGVPFLAWPIRGDQIHNAKLIVSHLKVGFMVSDDDSNITKDDIANGIERLMCHGDIKGRAHGLAAQFQDGFPFTSVAALDAFRDFINTEEA